MNKAVKNCYRHHIHKMSDKDLEELLWCKNLELELRLLIGEEWYIRWRLKNEKH